MILASILITSNEREEKDLPISVSQNITSFREAHPNLPHLLFTKSSIRELISDNFDAKVLSSYEKLMPFAYKSDLARYCIMYLYGGVYADLAMYFFEPWPPLYIALESPNEVPNNSPKMGLFQDFQSSSVWDTANSLFSCSPRHKALALAIDLVCENVKAEYYGKNSLCPTGPTLFGRAIAKTCEPEELVVGTSVWVDPNGALKEIVNERSHGFLFDNKLIALKRKRGGGPISQIGIIGGNSYNDMWQSNRVYASQL
jgi:hypothetical protein